jgi:hypothetical protein
MCLGAPVAFATNRLGKVAVIARDYPILWCLEPLEVWVVETRFEPRGGPRSGDGGVS